MYKITERQIIGMILAGIADVTDAGWLDKISMSFDSNQASEEYAWLGSAPAMREWVGGRLAKGLRENSLTIKNKKFEATVEILCDWLRRDKTGQIQNRISQLSQRANTHWASLLSTQIINGESTTCYDGQYFFDTDHTEGDSGTQDNDLSVDISAISGISLHGITTNPSPEEIQYCVLSAISAMLGFKDDQGEPMNEDARSFLVMVPISLWIPTKNAFSMQFKGAGESTQLSLRDFTVDVAANARLTWTEQFAVFRADGANKALIRQEEIPLRVSAKAGGSELEFDEDKHEYGLWASRNVGYGFWQSACLTTMT